MKASARKIMNSAPIVNFLSSHGNLADNKLHQAMEQPDFEKQLVKSGFRKQKGESLLQVMFATLIWPLLDVRSISNFCGRLLSVFIKGDKNVLYDFLKRGNLPWQTLRMRMAKQAYRKNGLDADSTKAFVFDDKLKHRWGKQVEGSSIHYDHTIDKHIRAHQVLKMGLVSSKGYLPLNSQIVVEKKKAFLRKKPFHHSKSGLQASRVGSIGVKR